jgi:photosystem II stability/assembly factor-like uncharacterized protein
MSKVRVLVGTEKGAFVFSSDRARRSWQVEGPLFKGWKVTASARSASGRYFLATASQVYGAALHVGEDFKNWSQIEQGPAYPEGGDHKLNQIWTLFQAPDRLYAGVDSAGLFFSRDDGGTWSPVGGLNDHPTRPKWFPGAGGLCAHSILVDPKRPERIWCGISAVGVWRSEDGGKSWQLKNRGVRQVIEDKDNKELGYCVHRLAQDPDHADIIYRQDHTGMYRTHDGGESWEKAQSGLPSWFGFPIAIDPRTKQLFCFPMESDEYRMPVDGKFRVYRSRDGAGSWEALSRGLPSQPSYAGVLRGAMAVDSLDPAGVYFGTTAGGVFASADGGESWQSLPGTLPRVLSVEPYVEN